MKKYTIYSTNAEMTDFQPVNYFDTCGCALLWLASRKNDRNKYCIARSSSRDGLHILSPLEVMAIKEQEFADFMADPTPGEECLEEMEKRGKKMVFAHF